MSLPQRLHHSLSPQEINFLAENEVVTILPRVTLEGIQLIGTQLPPLRAMKRVDIPLWLALILKSQDKCNIVPPTWLTLHNLTSLYQQEIDQPTSFSKLPWHWLEVSKMLLDKAGEDLVDPPHQLRSIVQDLLEVRLTKTRQGIKELNSTYLQLDNLSMTEISTLKPFCVGVMTKLIEISKSVEQPEDGQGGEYYADDYGDDDNENN